MDFKEKFEKERDSKWDESLLLYADWLEDKLEQSLEAGQVEPIVPCPGRDLQVSDGSKAESVDAVESERNIEEEIVKDFEAKFDKLTADKNNYGDMIEMLAAVVNSEAVQKIVNERYLEHQGYDLNDLAENGRKFFRSLIEANETSKVD